jgi:hypothetical protein
MRCANGRGPRSSKPSHCRTGRTNRASDRCTTTGFVLCIICYISVLTQYSAGTIYNRVEENPHASARGPEVSALQC